MQKKRTEITLENMFNFRQGIHEEERPQYLTSQQHVTQFRRNLHLYKT